MGSAHWGFGDGWRLAGRWCIDPARGYVVSPEGHTGALARSRREAVALARVGLRFITEAVPSIAPIMRREPLQWLFWTWSETMEPCTERMRVLVLVHALDATAWRLTWADLDDCAAQEVRA